MAKSKISREVTAGDISCLENLVVAYNTVLVMSSIFIILIASTTREVFSDFNRALSPSLLLFIVGFFGFFIGILGYVGVGKKSSSLISIYTMLLTFIFVMEIAASISILSFRGEIKSIISEKMKKAIAAYPTDPMTANLVDYVQLEFQCCGINSFRDWGEILEPVYDTNCKIGQMNLPQSCCFSGKDSIFQTVNKRGCFSVVNFMLHRSSLALATAVIAIFTIQVVGAYFSYTLASSLSKFKTQKIENSQGLPPPYEAGISVNSNEKSNYF